MISDSRSKVVIVLAPAAIIDNASPTTNVIDCSGYSYCNIYAVLGATDIAVTALKVQESDVAASATALTSGADVTGLIYGTSANTAGSTSTLPSATDDNKVFAFEIDCRKRKRYLDVAATMGDGTAGGYLSIIAVLSRGDSTPATAAERGCAQILRV